MGVPPVVIGGDYLPSPVVIGLTDLPNIEEAIVMMIFSLNASF